MENLSRDQAMKKVNELLGTDVIDEFQEKERHGSEHGEPIFTISNNDGKTVEVHIDWNKEADELFYSLNIK